MGSRLLDDVKGCVMAEEAIKPAQATGETVTPAPGSGQNNNTSNASEGAKTQTGGTPETVPYARFKEVNDKLNELKGLADKPVSTPLPDSPVDTVLDLIGKVPEHLKAEMKNIASYAAEHKMPVEDVISLWNVKTGNVVSKADVEQFNSANNDANNSRTGGSANPAARFTQDIKAMSDADLKTALDRAQAEGQI